MPIYEFECEACEHAFEELVSTGEDDVACPECSSTSVKRRISLFRTRKRSKLVKWHRLPGRKYKRPKPRGDSTPKGKKS